MCRGKRSGKCGGSSVKSGEWGCGGSRVGRVESEAWRERVEEQNGECVGCSGKYCAWHPRRGPGWAKRAHRGLTPLRDIIRKKAFFG